MKNRGIQRYIGLGIIAAAWVMMTGCGQIDVGTDEGLHEALQSGEKLDKAIPKIQGMMTNQEHLKEFVPDLVALYKRGSSFDREVIEALSSTSDSRADEAFEHCLNTEGNSKDDKQLMRAAIGIKNTGNAGLQKKLISIYGKQINPEVQRVILETGLAIKNKEITNLATNVLTENIEDTPFNLLRTSCDVLAYQKDNSTVDTLMRVVYHQDYVGRTLTTNCTRALLSLDRDVVAPVLLTAYKLENPALMDYVAKHPDTLTPESIRNNTANALALYRYEEAVPAMLDYLGNTKTIAVPGTLAIRPPSDPAWQMWASLVGVASQSTLFALNDIGVRNYKDRAKPMLTDIFHWTIPYQEKFKNAIDLTGTTNIEVSMRVNAFRTLRENDLITRDDVIEMIKTLKGEEFQDERKFRPWARASIGTDMVTYSAITARKGDLDTIWAEFNKLRDEEFKVPVPDDPDAPKVPHYNDSVSNRIDDTKPAFQLAEECDTSAECYANALKDKAINNYSRLKAIYEIGLSGEESCGQVEMKVKEKVEAPAPAEGEGNAKHAEPQTIEKTVKKDVTCFELICLEYKNLDVVGQLYGTKALVQLGSKKDVERIKALNKELSRSMNQIQYQTAKTQLEGLVTTLENKN